MQALKKSITKKEIAQRADISPEFFSHILHGRRGCPPAVAVRLEKVTGISRKIWVWSSAMTKKRAIDDFIYGFKEQCEQDESE